jgi:hypothetical protein
MEERVLAWLLGILALMLLCWAALDWWVYP